MSRSSTLSPKKSGYLPSLDGWRALAIFGVLMTHDQPLFVHGHNLRPYQGFGGQGVFLFFAISGILVCGRILEDEQRTGSFQVRSFYIRRLFRIQPALLCYLAVIALLTFAGVLITKWSSWFAALFLYINYLPHAGNLGAASGFVSHVWTLAVEEHFYILLSLLLFFVRRERILAFILVIALILTYQGIAGNRGFYSPDAYGRQTLWVLQFLLFPALCALLLRQPGIRAFAERYLHPWVAFAITVDWYLTLIGVHRIGPDLINILDAQCSGLLYSFSLWVIATMLHPRSWTTRFLELAPIRYMGRLSYSLYLWHVLYFVPAHTDVPVHSALLLHLSTRTWRYLASVATAILSYHFIEKPMIRLGHRLAPPATPGHRDLAGSVPLLGGPTQPVHPTAVQEETAVG